MNRLPLFTKINLYQSIWPFKGNLVSELTGFSMSWFENTGYARLFARPTGIFSRFRISGDLIPDEVIAILRFWRFLQLTQSVIFIVRFGCSI